MPVPTLNGPPLQFDAGSTVIFTDAFSQYSVTAWSMNFVLNLAGSAAIQTAATVSGTNFLVTLSATATAAMASGSYAWSEVVTETATSEVAIARSGGLWVNPNPTATLPPSFWASQVGLLQSVLAALAASVNQTVSINGQSYSKRDVSKIQEQLGYAEQRASLEQKQLAASRGEPDRSLIRARFASTSLGAACFFPYGPRL